MKHNGTVLVTCSDKATAWSPQVTRKYDRTTNISNHLWLVVLKLHSDCCFKVLVLYSWYIHFEVRNTGMRTHTEVFLEFYCYLNSCDKAVIGGSCDIQR